MVREHAFSLFEVTDDEGDLQHVTLTELICRTVKVVEARTARIGKKTSFSGDSERFTTDFQRLIHGQLMDAALGINHFMKVTDNHVYTGMAGGVNAIVAEIERAGTEEGKECLNYVLNMRAGSSPKRFPNSLVARDCDAKGLRKDRRLPSGAGMQLDDFVAHEHAITAQLSRAHVLALRLYST
jgi:hypothetical protein